MGYTQHTFDLINKVIEEIKPQSMVDLGAQNDYAQPKLPAPYVRHDFEAMGIDYTAIDLSGEDGCLVLDLSKPFKIGQHDLVVDAGTSEHVGKDGKHDIEAFYNCWLNKHNLCKVGGVIISENPKQSNWIGHGFNYVSQEFYKELAGFADYKILDLHEHPACGNITDGWNIICVMQKTGEKFPSLSVFKTFDVKTS